MDLDWIARELGAASVARGERIQSLWGGVGELFRIAITGGTHATAVVKWARLSPIARDASSQRKHRSFDVETAFYRGVAARCDASCRVPTLLAARASEGEWTLVLEDLDAAGFSERSDEADGPMLDAALAWLASFHARFLGERIDGVWPTGTYWHLETRRDELAAIADRALREAAPVLANRLAGARYQTLLHGDAKDANFCWSRDHRVAAVDFQYTGHGAGIIDVAYLLYGRRDEDTPLATYFTYLRGALASRPDVDVDALEAEWRALYPVAQLDFRRFLAGWRPSR